MQTRRITMAFSCSPKLLGKVYTCYGVVAVPLEVYNHAQVGSLWHWLTTPYIVIITLGLIAGVGLWLFKRGAIERTVTLGGWAESLYRRGRGPFLAVTLGMGLLIYTALSAELANIYVERGMAYGEAFGRYFIENVWQLLVMFHLAIERYTAFLQYDRSPEASRRMVLPPFRSFKR